MSIVEFQDTNDERIYINSDRVTAVVWHNDDETKIYVTGREGEPFVVKGSADQVSRQLEQKRSN